MSYPTTPTIFVNLAQYNLDLSTPTAAGVTLPTPFDTDPTGVARGSNSGWDPGAYEY